MQQSDEVIYYLSGPTHGLNLLVSLYSLRKFWTGQVAILSGCNRSDVIADSISSHSDLQPIRVIRWETGDEFPNELTHGGAIHSYKKCFVNLFSPFDRTMFLDADTLVMSDPLSMFPECDVMRFTQWGQMTLGERPDRSAFYRWRDVADQEFKNTAALNGPAINTGVFAFTKVAKKFFDGWREMANRMISYSCNEFSLQLILGRFEHEVWSDDWNCSPVWSQRTNPRIWHGHGNSFLNTRKGREVWMPACRDVIEKNIANVKDWIDEVPKERKPKWTQ